MSKDPTTEYLVSSFEVATWCIAALHAGIITENAKREDDDYPAIVAYAREQGLIRDDIPDDIAAVAIEAAVGITERTVRAQEAARWN